MILSLLASVLPKLVEKGFEYFKESKEGKEFKAALKEQIMAELRFNSEIIGEIDRLADEPSNDGDKKIMLLSSILSIEHFEALEKSGIPLRLIFDGKKSESRQVQLFLEKAKGKKFSKNFSAKVESFETEAEVVARVYHRIKILKALQQITISKGPFSHYYIQWLYRYILVYNS